jgi:hypothetical protein
MRNKKYALHILGKSLWSTGTCKPKQVDIIKTDLKEAG